MENLEYIFQRVFNYKQYISCFALVEWGLIKAPNLKGLNTYQRLHRNFLAIPIPLRFRIHCFRR